MVNKKTKMMAFWSERAKQYKSDPRANTNDIWLRELEINYVDSIIKLHASMKVMDFGCANGYSTIRLAKSNDSAEFTGLDLNHDMIEVAQEATKNEAVPNLEFRQIDILQDAVTNEPDMVYSIRVFQNMENTEVQFSVFDKLYTALKPNGIFLYIESYENGYMRLNEDRIKIDLDPLPIHNHLTLLTTEFDNYVSSRMNLLNTNYLSSSYYLITRLLYSRLAKTNNEPIDYNHPMHQLAAKLPQIGEYGPQRASVYQKILHSTHRIDNQ